MSIRIFVLQFVLSTTTLYAQQIFPANQNAYSVQMHVHGLSHHNGSAQPGSMQWHNYYADSLNLDAIWWSDHLNLFDQFNNNYFLFKGGSINSSNDIVGLNGSSVKPEMWVFKSNGGIETTTLSDSSITMYFKSNSNQTQNQFAAYSPRGTKDLLKGVSAFLKPLTCNPIFKFNLIANGLNTNNTTGIKLIFLLSWHKRFGDQQQVVTYHFTHQSVQPNTILSSSDSVLVTIPVYNDSNYFFELYPGQDAGLMIDGIDNTISDYQLKLTANSLAEVIATFSNMNITSNDTLGNLSFNNIKNLASNYASEYHLGEFIGAEYNEGQDVYKHINAFYPDTATLLSQMKDSGNTANDAVAYVNRVHSYGGVTSYNHPFGIDLNPLYQEHLQDYRTDTIYQQLLATKLYGCDIMEVGYYVRGHTDLEHHLELWDLLTAHGVFVYGNGTNDSHGGSWDFANKFVTWIWSPTMRPDSLIESIKKGRMFFGNIFSWSGKCYLTAGAAEMGDRTQSNCPYEYVKVSVLPLPPNCKVKLTHALIDSTEIGIGYLLKDVLIDASDSVLLDFTKPSFVRFTVYNENEVPLVCSNPIVFTNYNNQPNCYNELPSIYNPDKINHFELYPNPVHDEMKISALIKGSKELSIDFIHNNGTIAFTFKTGVLYQGKNVFPIDVSQLSNGVYTLHIKGEGIDESLKFVKY